MATRNTMHPSKYLKAEDMNQAYLVTIDCCVEEELTNEGRKEIKYVLYFKGGSGKGLVLNVTNSDVLFDNIDPDSDNWAGHQVIIYPTTTTFGKKKNVPCLRLRMPDQAPAEPAPAPVATTAPTQAACDALADEVTAGPVPAAALSGPPIEPPASTPVGDGQTARDASTGSDIPF